MSDAPFNKLGARKELGTILHRIEEQDLDPIIRKRLIDRSLQNLLDTLPLRFVGIIGAAGLANLDGNLSEVKAGAEMMLSMIPLTYGAIPAGTVFVFGRSATCTRRKDGIEPFGTNQLHGHLNPSEPVTVLNI